MEQIEKLSSSFFPQGGLQERSENFGLYFAAQGPAFITTLIEAFKPLDFKFTILAPSI